MNILITNHHLHDFAGSELFTFNLAIELRKRGHHIFCFSPLLGNIADKIKENGITVIDNIRDIENKKIDIIHAQHNTTAILARSIFPNVPIVFTVHGILPELEQPPSIDLDIAKFAVISEEIKDYLINNYSIKKEKIRLIRNFVDFNRFKPTKIINKSPKNLLVLSNHYIDKTKNIIENACNEFNIKFEHIGLPENSVENVEDYINNVDIVVTLGRGAIEAMACERNVIVYDMHGGDGYIDEDNFFEIRKNNFSGRRFKKEYSVEDFKKEILKYNPLTAKKLREIVLKENSVKNIVDNLESIYKEVLKTGKQINSQIKRGELFLEIHFLEQLFARNNKEKIKQMNESNRLIEVRDNEINKLNQIIQQKNLEIQKNGQIADLDQIIKQLNEENKKLNYVIQQKEQEIENMKKSKFWKLRNKYLKLKKYAKRK